MYKSCFNTLRSRQNGRHFADDTFKRIFLNENVRILLKISLKFVPKVRINNIPALVQIMAWRRPGDKPLSEPMLVRLPTHICVTRPQWVKHIFISFQQCIYMYMVFFIGENEIINLWTIIMMIIDLARNGNSLCANEILGVYKMLILKKIPMQMKELGCAISFIAFAKHSCMGGWLILRWW